MAVATAPPAAAEEEDKEDEDDTTQLLLHKLFLEQFTAQFLGLGNQHQWMREDLSADLE